MVIEPFYFFVVLGVFFPKLINYILIFIAVQWLVKKNRERERELKRKRQSNKHRRLLDQIINNKPL